MKVTWMDGNSTKIKGNTYDGYWWKKIVTATNKNFIYFFIRKSRLKEVPMGLPVASHEHGQIALIMICLGADLLTRPFCLDSFYRVFILFPAALIKYQTKAIWGRKVYWLTILSCSPSLQRSQCRKNLRLLVSHPVKSREEQDIDACILMFSPSSTLVQSRMPKPREWCHLQWSGFPTSFKSIKAIPHRHSQKPFSGDSRLCQVDI